MTIEKDETREYVAAMTAELAAMAQRGGLPFLAYLLGMAEHEAGRAAIVQRSAKAGSTAARMKQSHMRKRGAGRQVAG